MELKAYICPQCGAALEVDSLTVSMVKCPNCGNTVHIGYRAGENDPGIKTFFTADGMPLASAVLPDGYSTQGFLYERWQSELVPFTTRIRADGSDGSVLISDSKELFHDVRNVFIKGVIGLVPNHVSSGYTSFTEPDLYLKSWAENVFGAPLTETSRTALPSRLGSDPDAARTQLASDISRFDQFMEISSSARNVLCSSVMCRFTGTLSNGREAVVLAGMDYEGEELVYGGDLFRGLNLDNQYIKAVKERIDRFLNRTGSASLSEIGSTFSDVVSGREKLSFSDLMSGGIIGKAMRRKKENQAQPSEHRPSQVQQKNDSEEIPFGHCRDHGIRIDQITFGSHRKYFCFCYKENEADATRAFLDFVRTLQPSPSLAQKEADAISRKFSEIRQTVAQNQAVVMQKQAHLRQLQMQTSQMIAQNARSASAGLMDSFQKRSDAESRISQARSEAIRGVDTYTNSYGQTFDVSTAADHVYQNQYGDVFGISGQGFDQNDLNLLNLTELKKNE